MNCAKSGRTALDDELTVTVSRLRERAARCRGMARAAVTEGIAREFEAIARDYETDADRLQTRMPRPQ